MSRSLAAQSRSMRHRLSRPSTDPGDGPFRSEGGAACALSAAPAVMPLRAPDSNSSYEAVASPARVQIALGSRRVSK
jgi:hypothetical protein